MPAGKEIAEYKQHQPLDIEERAAWRDAQKIQAEEIEGRRDQDGKDTSKAEGKNRADEIQIDPGPDSDGLIKNSPQ